MGRITLWWCGRKQNWPQAVELARKLHASVGICPAAGSSRRSVEDRLIRFHTTIGDFLIRCGRVEILPGALPTDNIVSALADMFQEHREEDR